MNKIDKAKSSFISWVAFMFMGLIGSMLTLTPLILFMIDGKICNLNFALSLGFAAWVIITLVGAVQSYLVVKRSLEEKNEKVIKL